MGKSLLVSVFIVVALLQYGSATHNRAGEITIRQVGDLTIEVTVTTYTKTTSTQADRDSVRVFWGDGSSEFVFRINGDGTPLPNNRKLNYYVATHTYPGRATYTISMMDPNRNGGILNVNPPNSEGVPFYIEATYTFLNPQFQGYNNTAVLLEPPIDFGCVGQRFIHNPSAYDEDGDSLSFQLIVPLQDSGMNVPNYIWPQQIEPGIDNMLTLDPVSGTLTWVTPQILGEYNIAFRVNEYRDGVLISSFIRDMQIEILMCDNRPPEVSSKDEICIIAGETMELDIIIDDPDAGDLVRVTASGGPFEIEENLAVLDAGPGGFQPHPLTVRLIWTPECEQIRDQPYTVIIKAVDNFFDTTGLVDHHAIRIKVIGPPPLNPLLENVNAAFQLTWDLPYACDTADGDYFRGFSVWKRSGSNQFEMDTCETGLEGRGYTRIVANWKGTINGRYGYEDKDVEDEGSYCYRILAEFALTTPTGQPYLRVVSIPSEEVCLRVKADRPLITHVSVEETDPTDGRIRVKWIPPDATALDTIAFPGPYRYQLVQATGIAGTDFQPVTGGSFTATTFYELSSDSTFLITGLDTRSTGYNYRLDFFTGSAGALYGSSQEASSVYLTVMPSDEASQLSWTYQVPWDNYAFEIWRSVQGGPYTMIDVTTDDAYTDRMQVINGQEYCYQIIAFGDYGLTSVPGPLVNASQTACAIPRDNVPPCAPAIAVTNICDQANPSTPADAFANYLSWTMPCQADDIAHFRIFYSDQPGGSIQLVGEVTFPTMTFEHKPGERIAGCYSVTAVDQVGNESPFSAVVCVDNCPVFELPNAFTPNGDGQNDVFRPFRSRFIETIDFKVYNRWGQVVFSTSDPMINWNGENTGGNDVSEGVYFYTCEAYESQNLNPITLSGFIELIRGKP